MTADDGFADWLRANPAPDLQALVEQAGRRYAASIGERYEEDPFKRPAHQGGYQHITPEEWAEYDRAMAVWQGRQRSRHVVVCICGLAGVYWRPRKGGGPPIWRCEQHRNSWPDYAVEVPREASR